MARNDQHDIIEKVTLDVSCWSKKPRTLIQRCIFSRFAVDILSTTNDPSLLQLLPFRATGVIAGPHDAETPNVPLLITISAPLRRGCCLLLRLGTETTSKPFSGPTAIVRCTNRLRRSTECRDFWSNLHSSLPGFVG